MGRVSVYLRRAIAGSPHSTVAQNAACPRRSPPENWAERDTGKNTDIRTQPVQLESRPAQLAPAASQVTWASKSNRSTTAGARPAKRTSTLSNDQRQGLRGDVNGGPQTTKTVPSHAGAQDPHRMTLESAKKKKKATKPNPLPPLWAEPTSQVSKTHPLTSSPVGTPTGLGLQVMTCSNKLKCHQKQSTP